MTTLPVADGARMLGIHPKTLHHWLEQATVPVAAHPTDARIKCVTWEQIQQLARLHGRPLQSPATARSVASQEQAPQPPENEAESLQTAHSLPTSLPQEANLIQRLSCLETRVATLQEQLAQLALALLEERERSLERRISALETVTAELVGNPGCSASLPDAQVTGLGSEQVGAPHSPRQLNPAEQRARSRMPPLVEFAASGSYVIISSQEGELSLVPDSQEWFDWLATLSSFRFVGQSGRFTAYRESDRQGPTRTWTAHRCIHQRRYKHCLGVTDRLTIARLEQMAAKIQAYMDTI
jgi:DNA-binding transcriptional MerR regulator